MTGRGDRRYWYCGEPDEKGALLAVWLPDFAVIDFLPPAVHDHRVIYVPGYPEFNSVAAKQSDAFRKKHEPERAKLVPPHITLVFGVKEDHLPAITERVEYVSSQTHVFSIAFDRTAIDFDPFKKKVQNFLALW